MSYFLVEGRERARRSWGQCQDPATDLIDNKTSLGNSSIIYKAVALYEQAGIFIAPSSAYKVALARRRWLDRGMLTTSYEEAIVKLYSCGKIFYFSYIKKNLLHQIKKSSLL